MSHVLDCLHNLAQELVTIAAKAEHAAMGMWHWRGWGGEGYETCGWKMRPRGVSLAQNPLENLEKWIWGMRGLGFHFYDNKKR